MSRLIVKNLPKSITEDKLRTLFSEKGSVTDIQLKYTPEGKFRQFAFVGYQNETDAEEALKYFDKMCINTSKLTVERCAILGDKAKPKAWSKYSSDSTAYKETHKSESNDINSNAKERDKKKKKEKKTDLLEKYKSDPMFKEFMQVHVPNDLKLLEVAEEEPARTDEATEVDAVKNSDGEVDSEEENNKLALKEISDAEYMKGLITDLDGTSVVSNIKAKKVKEKIDLFTVKLRGLPYSCKKRDIKQFFSPLVPYTIRLPPKIKGIAYVGFKNEKQMNKALIKDKSFISGKRILVGKYTNQVNNEGNADGRKTKWKTQEEMLKNEENIAESGRIFLRNLPYTTTENEIQDLFSKYGPITEINLPIDTVTRKMKGFGVVTFLMPEHAVKAYSELDGSIFHGRMLHLLPGKAKDAPNEDLEESTNFKKKKMAKLKAEAGFSHNWNSLFLDESAVAKVMADTYGVSTKEVFDIDNAGSKGAVRLALGETQIVAETRRYLEQEGIILDAFSGNVKKRSNTIILVKNLPHKTEASDIRKLFEPFGILSRVILPPSGITAVVEFVEPSEARKAFRHLAYSKFHHTLLYLEWAPENCLHVDSRRQQVDRSKAEVVQIEEKDDVTVEEPIVAAEDDEEPEENTTLFVKNLNFQTTDSGLRKHFEDCGKIHYAKVATKKDKNNSNNALSMGFGFVQFKTKESADKALKLLQQSSLDGKSLELKRSERTLQSDVKAVRKVAKNIKQNGTKILVRNVPFQAKKDELAELFGAFGQVKALRIPKKMSADLSLNRGFAFVDFLSESDAKSAFDALCQSTHLYGRRLVLEWATTDESVNDIRKRTAEHFKPPDQVKSKKSVTQLNL